MGIVIAFIMLIFSLWGGADILALCSLSLLSPISLLLINGLPTIYNNNFLELILPLSLTIVMNAALIQVPLPFIILGKNYFRYRKNPEQYQLPASSIIAKIFASCLGEPLPVGTILTKPLFYYQILENNTKFTNKLDLNAIYPIPFIRLTSEPLFRWKEFRRNSYSLLQPNKHFEQENCSLFTNSQINKDKWSFDFSIGLKSEEEDLFRQRTLIHQACNDKVLKRSYVWVQYSVPFLIPMFLGYILAFNGINIIFILLKLLNLM